MNRVKEIAQESISKAMNKKVKDWVAINGIVSDNLAKFIFKETKRKPMILPIIMEI